MALLEEVADRLARQALDLMLTTGDETIEKRVAEEIGASSPTLQENFSTALRIRKAEARALHMLSKLEAGVGDAEQASKKAKPNVSPQPEPEPEPKSETVAETPDAQLDEIDFEDLEVAEIISLPAPDAKAGAES